MMHALLFVSMGVEARCCPFKSTAYRRHMKRQPFLCNGCPRRGRRHCHCRCHLHRRCRLHCCCRHRCVAIAYRHHRCCQPLPLWLPSTIATTISVALPSAIAVAVALAFGHCRLHHRWPSQLPLPLAITIAMLSAISESCCLGAEKNLFNQLKQRMLTLFYFVQRQWAVH
jgi:hypothetical protein